MNPVNNKTKSNSIIEYLLVLLFLILLFLPRILIIPNIELDLDESLWLVGIRKLFTDPEFYSSFDGTTSGPLVTMPLMPFFALLKTIDHRTLRMLGIVIYLVPAFFFLYLAARQFLNPIISILSLLPILLRVAFTDSTDFLAYNGEWPGILTCSILLYIFVLQNKRSTKGKSFISGVLICLMPFIKIQFLPISSTLFLYFLWKHPEKKIYILYFLPGCLSVAVILSVYLATKGLFHDFINSYILTSYHYSGQGGITEHQQTVIEKIKLLAILCRNALIYYWVSFISTAYFILNILLTRSRKTNFFSFRNNQPAKNLLILCIFLGIGIILALFMPGTGFNHYIQLFIPLLVLFLVFLFSLCYGGEEAKLLTRDKIFFLLILLIHAVFYFKELFDFNQDPHGDNPPWMSATLEKNVYVQIDSAYHSNAETGTVSIWGFDPKLYLYLDVVPGTRDGHTYFQSSNHNQAYYQKRYLKDLENGRVETIIELKTPHTMEMKKLEAFPLFNLYIREHYEKILDKEYFNYYKRRK